MELINVSDSQYEEYEALLMERDQLLKEAGQAWTAYIRIFGQLMTEGYEIKVDCIRKKKTIAYYQNALNHGGQIDQEAMRKYLARELAAYEENLKKMSEDHRRCKEAGLATDYEVQRSKILYRRIAKLLHPDINPETDRNQTLKELWTRVIKAYGKNSIKELTELEVLIRKTLKELGQDGAQVEIPDIDEKIAELRKEIDKIKATDPYQYRYLLEDEEAVAEKKKELEEELERFTTYRNELENVINDMLANGGLTIKWQMN